MKNGTGTVSNRKEIYAWIPQSIADRLEELRIWTGAPSISAMIAVQLELLLEEKDNENKPLSADLPQDPTDVKQEQRAGSC